MKLVITAEINEDLTNEEQEIIFDAIAQVGAEEITLDVEE